jgi:methylated-DNA-[protein]-cysteine S-methyltransferase
MTYQALALITGGSSRSIGQANRRNPIPILIPCHRVVAARGLGGYSWGEGIAIKRYLLDHEGASEALPVVGREREPT